MRPPISVRTSRSRPSSSVPNRCQPARVGGALIRFQSTESNALGSSIGPNTQASVISASTTTLRDRRAVAQEAQARVAPRAAAGGGDVDGVGDGGHQ